MNPRRGGLEISLNLLPSHHRRYSGRYGGSAFPRRRWNHFHPRTDSATTPKTSTMPPKNDAPSNLRPCSSGHSAVGGAPDNTVDTLEGVVEDGGAELEVCVLVVVEDGSVEDAVEDGAVELVDCVVLEDDTLVDDEDAVVAVELLPVVVVLLLMIGFAVVVAAGEREELPVAAGVVVLVAEVVVVAVLLLLLLLSVDVEEPTEMVVVGADGELNGKVLGTVVLPVGVGVESCLVLAVEASCLVMEPLGATEDVLDKAVLDSFETLAAAGVVLWFSIDELLFGSQLTMPAVRIPVTHTVAQNVNVFFILIALYANLKTKPIRR
jgi:hypothetical protein